ncbi:MAG: hypothetical protein C4582_10690, partial [Desulfobacteraceae bacterium]
WVIYPQPPMNTSTMCYAWQHEGFSCPLLTSDASGAVVDLMEGKIRTLPVLAQAAYTFSDPSRYMEHWK